MRKSTTENTGLGTGDSASFLEVDVGRPDSIWVSIHSLCCRGPSREGWRPYGILKKSFGVSPFPSSGGVICWGQRVPGEVGQCESQNFWPTIMVAGNR